jgi:hypothetical protein
VKLVQRLALEWRVPDYMEGIQIVAVALERYDTNSGKRHYRHKEVGDCAKHALQVSFSADCLPGPQHQSFPMLGQYNTRHCRSANFYFRRHISVSLTITGEHWQFAKSCESLAWPGPDMAYYGEGVLRIRVIRFQETCFRPDFYCLDRTGVFGAWKRVLALHLGVIPTVGTGSTQRSAVAHYLSAVVNALAALFTKHPRDRAAWLIFDRDIDFDLFNNEQFVIRQLLVCI